MNNRLITARPLSALVSIILMGLIGFGCQSDPDPAPETDDAAMYEAPVEPDPAPAPDLLAGSTWHVTSIVGAPTADITRITIEFGTAGMFTTEITRRDGSVTRETQAYTITADRIDVVREFGSESSSTYELFGDELTIDAPAARIRLRKITGPEYTIDDLPAIRGESITVDHLLAGTVWVATHTFGVNRSYAGAAFAFGTNGVLRMRIERHDGTANEVERRYRLEGREVLQLSDPLGHRIDALYEVRYDGNLVIDFPGARVVLEPVSR